MVKQKYDNLIYGIRSIIETIESGKDLEKIFIQKEAKSDLMKELLQLIQKRHVPFSIVPIEKINRFTGKNHQGAVAFVSPVQYYDLHNVLAQIFEEGKNPLILILDGITDVRNFGGLARTAECLGVDAILIPTRGGAQVNPDAIKTSAGALNYIPVCRSTNLKESITYLKDSGLQIVACTEKTDILLGQVDFKAPTALIMGSEDEGVSGAYLGLSDVKAKIHMTGRISSLNVAAATAMALYEIDTQRS